MNDPSASSQQKKLVALEREGRQLRRLEVLVDVVFAIILWRVFALVPKPSDVGFEGPLLLFFREHLREFTPSLIGVVLVVIYWIQNNTMFGNLERTDNKHAAISIFQLFALLLYLYTFRLGIEFEGDNVALLGQSLTLALAGWLAVWSWVYAVKWGRLASEALTEPQGWGTFWRLLPEPLTATLTIPVAWTSQGWWDLSWLVLIPLTMWTNRMARRAEALEG
jgi:uncharacterized membrane protein